MSYVELVRRRLQDRGENLMGNLDRLGEAQLRFTMRIFGDCLDRVSYLVFRFPSSLYQKWVMDIRPFVIE